MGKLCTAPTEDPSFNLRSTNTVVSTFDTSTTPRHETEIGDTPEGPRAASLVHSPYSKRSNANMVGDIDEQQITNNHRGVPGSHQAQLG